jgi:hypothetical protein
VLIQLRGDSGECFPLGSQMTGIPEHCLLAFMLDKTGVSSLADLLPADRDATTGKTASCYFGGSPFYGALTGKVSLQFSDQCEQRDHRLTHY